MAHTEGPWIVRYDKDGSPHSIERADGSLSIECDCPECRQDDPRQYHELVTCDSHVYGPTRQDAELMAAAPGMLGALKAHDAYMLEQFREGPDSSALHPKAAANWRIVRAAIKKAEGPS